MNGTVVQFDSKTELAAVGAFQNLIQKLPLSQDSLVWLNREDLDFVSEGVHFKVNNISCCSIFTKVFDYCVKLKIGSHAASLFLDRQLVEKIVGKMAPEAGANFLGAGAALLLELAFSEAIVQVERVIGRAINFTSVERAPSGQLPPPNHEWLPVDITIFVDRIATSSRIHLCVAGNRILAQLLKRLPTRRLRIDHLPIVVGFEVGHAVLSVGEFMLLEQGDVIFSQEQDISSSRVTAVIADRLYASATAEENQLRIFEPFKHRENAMSDEPLGQDSSLSSLDEIEVKLTFEIGRKSIPLSELETLAPGYVFELDRKASATIDVVSGGRRIGRADLVEIGDRVGVRLLEIFRHG